MGARPPRRQQSTESESPMPSRVNLYDSSSSESPTSLHGELDESSSESEASPLSSQASDTTSQREARSVVIGRNDSPDELAQDHYEDQPGVLQQRQLNRIKDEDGNLRRISFGQLSSSPMNLHAPTISTGTQTVDEERQRRDANAPPPSSFNSSQQTHHPLQDDHDSGTNSAEDAPTPASMVEIPRPFNPPPAAKIDLVFNYNVLPGFNVQFHPAGNIFIYSLQRFFHEVDWQSAPEVLLICLEAPRRTHMDLVFKNDEDQFGLVMRRFKQVVQRLKADHERLKMDAVIEIAFEPIVEGHTHSMLFDAWCRAGTKV